MATCGSRNATVNHWWLSSKRMTVRVRTRKGVVVEAAPIVRKFQGQPLSNLVNWMSRQDGFRMVRLR